MCVHMKEPNTVQFLSKIFAVVPGQLVCVGDFVYKVHGFMPQINGNAIYELELVGKKSDMPKLVIKHSLS